MPFVNQKEYAKLLARVDAIEEELGLNVEIPNIEYVVSLQDIYGDELADLLISGGKLTPLAVKNASDDDLLDIKGLGPATVKKIREAG
jgi:hypothetical protein